MDRRALDEHRKTPSADQDGKDPPAPVSSDEPIALETPIEDRDPAAQPT